MLPVRERPGGWVEARTGRYRRIDPAGDEDLHRAAELPSHDTWTPVMLPVAVNACARVE